MLVATLFKVKLNLSWWLIGCLALRCLWLQLKNSLNKALKPIRPKRMKGKTTSKENKNLLTKQRVSTAISRHKRKKQTTTPKIIQIKITQKINVK